MIPPGTVVRKCYHRQSWNNRHFHDFLSATLKYINDNNQLDQNKHVVGGRGGQGLCLWGGLLGSLGTLDTVPKHQLVYVVPTWTVPFIQTHFPLWQHNWMVPSSDRNEYDGVLHILAYPKGGGGSGTCPCCPTLKLLNVNQRLEHDLYKWMLTV